MNLSELEQYLNKHFIYDHKEGKIYRKIGWLASSWFKVVVISEL